jgi:urease accessory protein
MMRRVFSSLPVVTAAHRVLPAHARPYSRDTMTLGWEERVRTRGRRFSDAGLAFGTTLPRGTVLRAGDWLVVEEHQVAVEVIEQPEPVFVVEPRSPAEWGLFAYYIGNSHQPAMITADAIVCADLPGMEQVLAYHVIPFRRDTRPFTPVAMGADHQHLVG